MAKNNVLFNGLSAVTSGSNGMLLTFPDVCKTQVGPAVVPIPYPNIAQSADLDKGSKKVMIEGKPASLESSTFSKSTGDEAGSLKGIISSAGQGEAKPLLFSPTVFIEGKAVVRNTDIFSSNKMNTPPAPVMQAQVPPGIPPTIEDAAPKCPKCDKDLNKNCLLANTPVISKGTNKRNNYTLYKGIKNSTGNAYPKGHPWYNGPRSLEVHHCIDVDSVTTMGKLFKKFHYNINEAHNTVVMPADMKMACQLAVPRHKGEHGAGRKFADDPSTGKDKENIENLEKLEDDNAGSADYSAVTDEETGGKYTTYIKAVKDELRDIKDIQEEGWKCHSDEGQPKSEEEIKADFEKEMSDISKKILDRLADFSWTLSADGRDYRPGNKCGRSGADVLTNHKTKTKKNRGNECTAKRKHGFSAKTYTLELGK